MVLPVGGIHNLHIASLDRLNEPLSTVVAAASPQVSALPRDKQCFREKIQILRDGPRGSMFFSQNTNFFSRSTTLSFLATQGP